MRQIDHHAEVVHAGNDLASEVGEAAVHRIVVAAVGPVGMDGVKQRHVPGAGLVGQSQSTERVLDAMAAFDGKQRRDLAVGIGVDVFDVIGAECGLQRIRNRLPRAVEPLRAARTSPATRPAPQARTGTYATQNCAPTPPARRRSRSVCIGGSRALVSSKSKPTQVEAVQVVARPFSQLDRGVVVPPDERRLGQQSKNTLSNVVTHSC